MDIRLHALKSIRDGMPARFAVQTGVAGIQFLADDQEFIELSDLGYNQTYGYYRLSALPSVRSECENDARETIHRYNDGEDGDPMYVWQDGDGYLHQLGELWQVAELYQALGALLLRGELAAEVIDEFDPRWGQNYTIAQAVSEAITYGYATDADQTADSIRAAARAGRIKGACIVDGKWSIPKRTLRGWLVRNNQEKRGRPRKAGQ